MGQLCLTNQRSVETARRWRTFGFRLVVVMQFVTFYLDTVGWCNLVSDWTAPGFSASH